MSAATPMHWGERFYAYAAQRGGWRLTARQERRYLRKAHRAGELWPAVSHLRLTSRGREST